MANIIETFSGKKVNLENPLPSTIDLEDIAHHLSQTCRFVGATSRFYSVAEHAVRCSYLVPEGYELAALHHDSSEAFLADLPGPLKNCIGEEYGSLTRNMDRAIFRSDAFKSISSHTLFVTVNNSAEVKAADQAMLAFEAKHLIRSKGEGWTDYGLFASLFHSYARGKFNFSLYDLGWDSVSAKKRFIQRHKELIGG